MTQHRASVTRLHHGAPIAASAFSGVINVVCWGGIGGVGPWWDGMGREQEKSSEVVNAPLAHVTTRQVRTPLCLFSKLNPSMLVGSEGFCLMTCAVTALFRFWPVSG